MCGNVTALFLLSLKKTVQTPLQKRQVCPKIINVIMGNNQPHKSGANSTFDNLLIKGFPLSSHIFIWNCPVCFAVTKCPSENFDIFICFHQWPRYKIRNLWCHVTSHTRVKNPIGELQNISKVVSRTFCIVGNTCHRRVYLLWLDLICTVFQHHIYFRWSIRTSFRLFRVPVNIPIQSVQFWTICDEIILQSRSGASIWFLAIAFSMLIVIVAWINRWFITYLILYLLFKAFSSWVWTYTVTALWLSKNVSLCIFYPIFQIQIINL